MRAATFRLAALLVTALTPAAAWQTPARPATSGPDLVDSSIFSGLKWRSIGPVNTSGRIDDIDVARVTGQPDVIYVATASGGVFKSTNGGTSWMPIFDNVEAMMSIGDIAVAPSNPNIIWAGTGEANNRQSSSWGDGVYKSTDAGRTWQFAGLRETRHIGRVIIDPANPDVVYVAAVGHLWGSNPDRGVFKTSDGGRTWRKTLFIDVNTGANDLAIDPQNPRTLYASTYQRQRKSWGFNGGGPGSGLYKSTDAGEHWTKLTKGLPQEDMGRIGLDIFRGDGTLVYAVVEAAGGAGGLYRSGDGGASWERLSAQNPRPSYYSQIRVDPKDGNRLYMLGSNRGFFVSTDGGRSVIDMGVTGVHGEDHALWVDPSDTNHLIIGGDGGVSISWDRGRSWDFRANMPIGQFYEIDADMRVPYTVCGGLQDNGSWCVPSAVRDRNGISNRDAWNVGSGDGFHVKFDPTDNNFAYVESQNGAMSRVNLLTLERQPIRPPGAGLRWNWDTPIHVSTIDPKVVFTGANILFRSPDRGMTWTPISPDLTAQIDPESLEIMGARLPPNALSRNDGTSPFGSLTSIGESPLNANVIYTGAQDGTVQSTKNGGKTWTNLTTKVPSLPPYTYVSAVVPSRHVVGRVYATFDGHYNDDYRPYVYVSDDFGQTWRSLAAGLPETSINRIREHPRDPQVLVLAHERGVHVSNNGGRSWLPLSLTTNLPPVPTDDVMIHPRDNALIAGTHGRGIWILDDLAPVQSLTADALRRDALLVPIAPARLMITYAPQAWFGSGVFFAPNPDFDASLTYYLREAASGPAQVEIHDATGRKLRTIQGPAAKGLNRARWDLRRDATIGQDKQPAGRGNPAPGPLVPAGKYLVVLRIPGISQELRGDLIVEADPLVSGKR